MQGVMEICEGRIKIDGAELVLDGNGGRRNTFFINTDKVVAFYCVNGRGGENSDISIITDAHLIYVEGYKGLGEIHADQLEAHLRAPVGVNYRKDGKVFDDDEISVNAQIAGEVRTEEL